MDDKLDKFFDIEPVTEVISPDGKSTLIIPEGEEDEDHNYARARHYELAEKGSEALDIAMKVVRSSETPSAIKELSGLIKTLSEVNKTLLGLHKYKADVKTAKTGTGKGSSLPLGGTNVQQQNIIFAGSSKDLNKLINEQFKNHLEDI